ncbi:hypothetical protein B0A49_05386 [Cryomyces minteri]|uniref:Phytase-like domain-containing protein n=1 Tax=Cryomyces minteri TaxID=331657 RepID=A0A4U0X201_9PEZI|nr:hypothetical protein B0A49_05386 [Cryomyces minteri]
MWLYSVIAFALTALFYSNSYANPTACSNLLSRTYDPSPDTTSSSCSDSVTTIYQFSNGTWIENIAVRSNSNLLLHTFPDAGGLLGIAEISPDIFAVVAGTFNFATFTSVAGSYSTWRVDLRFNDLGGRSKGPSKGASPSVTKITDLPQALFLNGMTILPNTSYVLIADPGAGVVRHVDTGTGEYEVVLSDTATMAPPENAVPATGINGLHVQGS